jgi:hypothetical protein
MSGLILLVLTAALAAWGWTRLRGKMKLSVPGRRWLGPVVVIVVIVLLTWSVHAGGH